MIRPANHLQNPARYCPSCGIAKVARVVYGYPDPSEFLEGCVYGGAECSPESATHFCDKCEAAWHVHGCEQLFYENSFPDTCQFCEVQLSDRDMFQCNVEYEGWLAGKTNKLCLEEPFADANYFIVCGKCREGVATNRRNIILEESLRLEESRQWFMYFGIVLVVVLVIVHIVETYFL